MKAIINCVLFITFLAVLVFPWKSAIAFDETTSNYRIFGERPYLWLDDNLEGVEWFLSNDALADNAFSISWAVSFNVPFVIEYGSPTHLLYLDADGKIGINTNVPSETLELQSTNPAIRLVDTTAGSGKVDLDMDLFEFAIQGETDQEIMEIDTRAPSTSLKIDSDGNVGLGTSIPSAQLELFSFDTFNFFRITAAGAPTNDSVDFVFTQGPAGTGELRYNIVDGDGPEMRLDADGNMTLDGELTTAGPSCSVGCDVVFDEDYELRSIDEHAALMWEARHLPAVGPTEPSAPVNLTEKMGDMLNELEHAHIYIAQLNEQNKAQETHIALLSNRLAEQEAQLAKQATLNAALFARLHALEAAHSGN